MGDGSGEAKLAAGQQRHGFAEDRCVAVLAEGDRLAVEGNRVGRTVRFQLAQGEPAGDNLKAAPRILLGEQAIAAVQGQK